MPFTHIKNTYFSELIHELTNLEFDHSQYDHNGRIIDEEDYQAEYIRASKYSQFNEVDNNLPHYGRYLNEINVQCLNELMFLNEYECEVLLRRLTILSERFEKAWEAFKKHYNLYSQKKFSPLDFELDFFYLFNIPQKEGFWNANNNPTKPLKVSFDFFMDLQDALMYKDGALKWLTYYIRVIYNIKQPEGTVIPAKDDNPSPDKSEIVNIGFDVYINEKYREKLMPYLVNNYTSAKPELYGFVLYALTELKYIATSVLTHNQSALHRALKVSFGEVGTRQSLNTALNRIDPRTNDADKRQIDNHRNRISEYMQTKE